MNVRRAAGRTDRLIICRLREEPLAAGGAALHLLSRHCLRKGGVLLGARPCNANAGRRIVRAVDDGGGARRVLENPVAAFAGRHAGAAVECAVLLPLAFLFERTFELDGIDDADAARERQAFRETLESIHGRHEVAPPRERSFNGIVRFRSDSAIVALDFQPVLPDNPVDCLIGCAAVRCDGAAIKRAVADDLREPPAEFRIGRCLFFSYPFAEVGMEICDPVAHRQLFAVERPAVQIQAENLGRDVPFGDEARRKRYREFRLLFLERPVGVPEDVAVARARAAEGQRIDARFIAAAGASDALEIVGRVGRHAVQYHGADVAEVDPHFHGC